MQSVKTGEHSTRGTRGDLDPKESGSITLITAIRPALLGKTFELGINGLEKTVAGELCEGRFDIKHFDTATEFAELISTVGKDQTIMASLPKRHSQSNKIVTKAAHAKSPDSLTRTKDDFGFPFGRPDVVILDYDPPSFGISLNQNDLFELVASVMPVVKQAGVVWWSSGSSYIYKNDTEVRGLLGQRLYLLVRDLGDTLRFGDVFAKRLWLKGLGHVAVSSSGQKLIRSVFDAAMFQPARLDFIGGAICVEPLQQRRGEPIVLSAGLWLDTRLSLPDLTNEEEAEFEALVENAKTKAEPQARAARDAWCNKRRDTAVARLTSVGITPDQAHERIERTLNAALNGILLGDFVLTLADGKAITVEEVLEKKEYYHYALTRDPVEPDYQNGKVTGKLYLLGATPTLHSFAHGGATYRLKQQPARLYLQRGRRAELVDQIYEVLAKEPDVFSRGGLLVLIENGRVRHLRKPALMHLISSRIALFKNDKGRDIPEDLPGEVVDMVAALVEYQT